MRKISKSRLKVSGLVILAAVASLSLAGCSDPEGNKTLNAVTNDFETTYLRVNDTNTVCFKEKTGSSSYDGTVCDFSEITIPNGVNVVVLTNNEPVNEDWRLNHFVDLKNKTSDCLYIEQRLVSCNFLSDAANGSFGSEK